MKLIKLVLVFLMILGLAIAGCFFIFGGLDSASFSKFSNKDYVSLGEQFNEDWNEVDTWNEDLFRSHMRMIEDIPQDQNAEFLRDMDAKRAIGIVFNSLMMEWESPTCRKSFVDENINALNIIESLDLKAFSNIDIVLSRDIYEVYVTAHKLITQPIDLDPQFNGVSWNSFSSYKSMKLSKKESIVGNNLYQKYLSNISEFKTYFEDLNDNLSAAKKKFAGDLANQICAYYQNAARTPSKLANFRSVRAKYTAEFSSNSRINDLLLRFSNDVERSLRKR